MLHIGDEIIAINEQVIVSLASPFANSPVKVGWRTRAVANLLRESPTSIVFTVRMTVSVPHHHTLILMIERLLNTTSG